MCNAKTHVGDSIHLRDGHHGGGEKARLLGHVFFLFHLPYIYPSPVHSPIPNGRSAPCVHSSSSPILRALVCTVQTSVRSFSLLTFPAIYTCCVLPTLVPTSTSATEAIVYAKRCINMQ